MTDEERTKEAEYALRLIKKYLSEGRMEEVHYVLNSGIDLLTAVNDRTVNDHTVNDKDILVKWEESGAVRVGARSIRRAPTPMLFVRDMIVDDMIYSNIEILNKAELEAFIAKCNRGQG